MQKTLTKMQELKKTNEKPGEDEKLSNLNKKGGHENNGT